MHVQPLEVSDRSSSLERLAVVMTPMSPSQRAQALLIAQTRYSVSRHPNTGSIASHARDQLVLIQQKTRACPSRGTEGATTSYL